MEPEESFWSRNPLQSSKLGTDGDSDPPNSAEANVWVLLILPSASPVYYSKIPYRSRVTELIAWNFQVHQLSVISGNQPEPQ